MDGSFYFPSVPYFPYPLKLFDILVACLQASQKKATSTGNGKGSKGKDKVAAPAAVSSKVEVAPASKAAASPAKKRTTLSDKEQEEYKKLSAEMTTLTAKRDALQAQLSKASSKELAKKSVDLATVQDELDAKELRWLELAEVAGDI